LSFGGSQIDALFESSNSNTLDVEKQLSHPPLASTGEVESVTETVFAFPYQIIAAENAS
jgi:hypothetical protein